MKKKTCHILVLELVITLALVFYNNVCAYDPDPLQDFCVATDHLERKGVFVNGKFCKNPKKVTADDFYYPRIDIPSNINSKLYGVSGTYLDVDAFPGLNTLGVSLKRIEYEPKAVDPPLINSRASEIIVVIKGRLKVGFVTSNLDGNRLFEKTLKKGDVFVFPAGLVHFKQNVGDTKAVTLHALGTQNSGTFLIPKVLFGSKPRIDPVVLAKSFQTKENVIEYLQSINWEQ